MSASFVLLMHESAEAVGRRPNEKWGDKETGRPENHDAPLVVKGTHQERWGGEIDNQTLMYVGG